MRKLNYADAVAIRGSMKIVARDGMRSDFVRHVRGDIHEVRINGERASYRILFAKEGRYSQVFVSLVLFEKSTRKTPRKFIELAESRLKDWRDRGKGPKENR